MSNSPGQWNDGVLVASAAARLDHLAGNRNSRCLFFDRDSCPPSRFIALLLNACHVFFGRYAWTEHIASGSTLSAAGTVCQAHLLLGTLPGRDSLGTAGDMHRVCPDSPGAGIACAVPWYVIVVRQRLGTV